MASGYQVVDPKSYMKLFNIFNAFDKEINELLNSEKFSVFRDFIRQSEKELSTFKTLQELIKDTQKTDGSIPYSHIYRYLLMAHFKITTYDQEYISLSDVLQLEDFAKSITIVDLSTMIQKGGDPDDELALVPGDAVGEYRRDQGMSLKRRLLLGASAIACGCIAYNSFYIFKNAVSTSLQKAEDSMLEAHQKNMGAAFKTISGSEGNRYLEYIDENPSGPPEWFLELDTKAKDYYLDYSEDFSYIDSSDKPLSIDTREYQSTPVVSYEPSDTSLTTLSKEDFSKSMDMYIAPPDSKFNAVDVYNYENLREAEYNARKALTTTTRSYIDSILDLRELSTEDIFNYAISGTLPTELLETRIDIGTEHNIAIRNALLSIGDTYTNRVSARYLEQSARRFGRRSEENSRLLTDSYEEGDIMGMARGIAQMIGNSFLNTGNGPSIMGTVVQEAVAATDAASDEAVIMSSGVQHAFTVYITNMRRWINSNIDGIRVDLYADSGYLTLSTLFAALSATLLATAIIPERRVILDMFYGALIFILRNDPRIGAAIGAAVFTGIIPSEIGNALRGRREGRPRLIAGPTGGKKKKSSKKKSKKQSKKKHTRKNKSRSSNKKTHKQRSKKSHKKRSRKQKK